MKKSSNALNRLHVAFSFAVAGGAVAPVSAQIFLPAQQVDVTLLAPSFFEFGRVAGTTGARQYGARFNSFTQRVEPIAWNDSPLAVQSLLPRIQGDLASKGVIISAKDGEQGGNVSLVSAPPFETIAALWRGTTESFVSLHPKGAYSSQVNAVGGGAQVGEALSGDRTRNDAILWRGTAESAVVLNGPAGTSAYLSGTDGAQQVGQVTPPHPLRSQAALWEGTSGSYRSLHPTGAHRSDARAVQDGVQGGFVSWSNQSDSEPVLWLGTAESLIRMGAPGEYGSVEDIDDGWQVGFLRYGSNLEPHAVLWHGSASGFIDLHFNLPPEIAMSVAESIEVIGDIIRVTGNGRVDTPDGTFTTPISWVITIPEPSMLLPLTLSFARRRFRPTARRPRASTQLD